MKTYAKFFSLVMAVIMSIGMLSGITVFAAENSEASFIYSEMAPVVYQQCSANGGNDAHSNGGTVWYTGYKKTPETLANDLFDQSYFYMQKGTGADAVRNVNNYMQFDFDAKALTGKDTYTLKHEDVVYFSFYYRSPQTFDFDGTTCQGTDNNDLTVRLGGNQKYGITMINLNEKTAGKNVSTSLLNTKADGKWHKVELGFMVYDTLNDNRKAGIMVKDKIGFTMDFNQLRDAFKLEFAGFTVGIWNFAETETSRTHYRALDNLCRTLESIKPDVKKISTDGNVTDVIMDESNNKVYRYTVRANSYKPEIKVSNLNDDSFIGTLSASSVHNGKGEISMVAYGPFYDKTEPAEPKSYITFTDLASVSHGYVMGYDDEKCTLRTTTGINNDYKENFILTANMRMTFLKDDVISDSEFESGEDGSKYTVRLATAPVEDGSTLYIAAFKGETVLGVKSALFADGSAEASLEKIVNTDNSVLFKVFIWGKDGSMVPVSLPAEISENLSQMPEIL